MKYCVAGRQPYSVLKKADEVKVQYRDIDRILDFIEKIPDKIVILEVIKLLKSMPFCQDCLPLIRK